MNRVRKSSRVNPINREIREMISKVFRGGVQKGKKKHECMCARFFSPFDFSAGCGPKEWKKYPSSLAPFFSSFFLKSAAKKAQSK